MSINGFDIFLILAGCWAMVRGWCSGFLIELSGIFGIMLGVWVSYHFGHAIGVMLGLEAIPRFWLVVVITLGVLLAVGVLSRVLTKILEFGGFGGWVRVLGAVTGAAKVLLYAALLTVFVDWMGTLSLLAEFTGLEYIRGSWSFPYLEQLGEFIFPYLTEFSESVSSSQV